MGVDFWAPTKAPPPENFGGVLPAAAATVPARASFKLNPSAQHGGVGAGALTAEIFATHYLSSPPMY